MSAAAPLYEIRSPEQTILYSVVASELETFLAEQRSAEHEVPRFVEREFRAFLGCGVLHPGFLRVHCGSRGRVLVQETRLAPLVWRSPHGRNCGALSGSRTASGPDAAVGAVGPPRPALPHGV